MPRSKKAKYSRLFKKTENKSEGTPTSSLSGASTPSTSSSRSSSSETKVVHRISEYDFYDDNVQYDIVDLQSFGSFLSGFMSCTSCGGTISIEVTRRCGIAFQLSASCGKCTQQHHYKNSTLIKRKIGEKKFEMHDVNLRLIYSFRTIGKGLAGAKTFCAMMNLPPPNTNCSAYEKTILDASRIVAEKSMEEAVNEAIKINENHYDIPIALDGTWQKRGHVSLNGVVTATSIDSGKVLDVAAFSKFCKCTNKSAHQPNCTQNFQGTSGAMEVQGALDIFSRSEKKYGVRYTEFLGDGDSKAYRAVVERKIYGPDCNIAKLECIGHVQKRMGSRLRVLKQKCGKKKLADGKPLGGKGRLTDSAILAIQKYYGYAIRNNLKSVDAMKKAIWAEYFHLASSDEHPSHDLCPKGETSSCKFRIAEAKGEPYIHGQHFHLPYFIMLEIKQIFQDLANPELLKKCLHGGTQNSNESFNNCIWARVPKNIFVNKNTIELGLYDAVSCFNEGNVARCRVYNELGIKPGTFCVETLKKMDQLRIKKAAKKIKKWEINLRRKRSSAKKKLEDAFTAAEEEAGPSYASGHY